MRGDSMDKTGARRTHDFYKNRSGRSFKRWRKSMAQAMENKHPLEKEVASSFATLVSWANTVRLDVQQ
jgi:hypothetical protein